MKSKWLKGNWKLRIGVSFILVLLFASLTSTYWIPKDPYFMETYRSFPKANGGFEYSMPPYPIGKLNWMSSDMFGRDLFSRILIGAKMTFVIVVLLTIGKMLLSIPLGMLAGGGKNRLLDKMTEYWAFVFSGFPTLIAAVFIFSMPLFSQFSFWERIFIMIAILVLMEWARIALIIKGRTEQIMKEPYIEGAKVLGRRHAGILRVHVWRMIFPDVVILFVFECARSLMLLGQMAMLGVYFLDTLVIENDPLPPFRTSLTPEWGALLGESRAFIFSNPIVTFLIAGTIVLTTIALNLIGEGIKDKYLYPAPKKSRKVYQMLRSRPLWQKAAIGLVTACLIVTSLFIPQLSTTSANGDYDNLESQLKALNERFIGTDQAKEAADLIAKQWEDIGLSPVHDTFISQKNYGIKRKYKDVATLSIHQGNEEQTFEKQENVFQLPEVSVEMGEVTAPLAFVNPKDQDVLGENIMEGVYDGKIVVLPVTIENQNYFFENMNDIVRNALISSDIKGIIYSIDAGEYFLPMGARDRFTVKLDDLTEDKLKFFPVFVMKNEAAAELKKSDSATLKVQLEGIESTNVEATFGPTFDPSKQTVILYSYYDKKYDLTKTKEEREKTKDVNAESVAGLTTIAEQLLNEKDIPDFNYYFLAFDGTDGKQYGFRHWLAEHPDITATEPFMVQVTKDNVPEKFEKVGANLATLTYNISTQAERNATERALSVSAWKEGFVPYHGKSSMNIPQPLNSPVKHINLISEREEMVPFVIRFLDNLEHEYKVLFDSIEGVSIKEDKMQEQLKQLGLDVKAQMNDTLKKAMKEQDDSFFMSMQNEANPSFYKEQQHWFEVVKKHELLVDAKILWVSLTSLDQGETKLRIKVEDPVRQTNQQFEVVYQLSNTESGWKLNDMAFEQMTDDKVIIDYGNSDKMFAERVKESAENTLSLLQKQYHWKPSEPIHIKLYGDLNSMLATVPKLPSSIPQLDENGILEPKGTIKLLSTASEEKIIQAISKWMINDLSDDNVSSMVQEGLANVISLATVKNENQWSFDLSQAQANIMSTMNGKEYSHLQTLMMPTLEQLIEPGFKDNYYYNAGTFFAFYLYKEKGRDSLLELLSTMKSEDQEERIGLAKEQNNYERTKQALIDTYGSLDKLEEQWNSFSDNLKQQGKKKE